MNDIISSMPNSNREGVELTPAQGFESNRTAPRHIEDQYLVGLIHGQLKEPSWWDGMNNDGNLKKMKLNFEIASSQRTSSIQGHLGSVLSITAVPDESLMITGSFDSVIKVWDLKTGICLKDSKQHKGAINRLVVFLRMNCFFSASSDGNIFVWDLEHYEVRTRIKTGHFNGVSGICVGASSMTLFSSGLDGTIMAWDLTKPDLDLVQGSVIYASKNMINGQINSIEISEQENILVSAHEDGTVGIFSTQSQGPKMLKGHTEGVQSLCITKDEQFVFSGSKDNSIRIWNVSQGMCIKKLVDHYSAILNLKLNQTESQLISTCNNMVFVWNTQKWTLDKQFEAHQGEIYCIWMLHKTNIIVTGSIDRTVRFWDMDKQYANVNSFEGHSDAVLDVLTCVEQNMMFTASADFTVKAWSLDNRSCLATFEGHTQVVKSLAYSPKLRLLFSGSKDGSIRCWDASTKKLSAKYEEQALSPVHCIQLLEKRQTVASASDGPSIVLWKLGSKDPIAKLEGHVGAVYALRKSDSENYLYSGGEDMSIYLWDLRKTVLLAKFGAEVHTKPITCLEFCRGLKMLFSGSEDKTVLVWNSEEFTLVSTLEGHKNTVTRLRYSDKMQLLYSASLDGKMRTWDVVKGKIISNLGRENVGINCLDLDQSESNVYFGSNDSTVKIFKVRSEGDDAIEKLVGHSKKINDILLMDDSDLLLSTAADKSLRIWEQDSLVCRQVHNLNQVFSAMVYCRKKQLLYCGAEDSKVRIFDPFSNETNVKGGGGMDCFNGQHEDVITCMCLNEEESLLFTGSSKSDQIIKCWNVESQNVEYELLGQNGSVTKLKVNRESTYLFAGSNNFTVVVYNLLSRQIHTSLKGHRETVNDLVLSLNETYLYTASSDHTVKAWNLMDESVMETYTEHTDDVTAIVLSPNGNLLFSAGKDFFINIYLTIDGSIIYKFKCEDPQICSLRISNKYQTLYVGGVQSLLTYQFSTFKHLKDLDSVSMECFKNYFNSDTNVEKSTELRNFADSLEKKGNPYYIHRVNPVMFMVNMPFPEMLKYALNVFKYPKFSLDHRHDLLYRCLLDESLKGLHLSTVCDYLIDHPEEFYPHQNTIEEMMKHYDNVKIQKLLQHLFNAKVKGQEGVPLITKGKLKSNPIMKNTTYIDTIPLSLNKELIRSEKKLHEITYKISKFPMNIHNGTPFSLLFFKGLNLCEKDVILSDMKYLINYKWLKLKKVIIVHAICFFLFIMVNTVYLVFYPAEVWLGIICLVLSLAFILFELTCAKGDVVNFILRGLNWLDIVCFVFNIFTLIIAALKVPNNEIMIAIDVFLYMFRGITYLRIFDGTRYLVAMILRVFTDMISFLIISILWVVMFSLIFKVLHRLDEEPKPERSEFWKLFIHVFLLANAEFQSDDYTTIDWIVCVLAVFIVTLAIFNLLIAIIGNTYEWVKENRDYFDIKEKLAIITDFDNFLHQIGFNKKKSSFFSYMVMAYYPETNTEDLMINVNKA